MEGVEESHFMEEVVKALDESITVKQENTIKKQEDDSFDVKEEPEPMEGNYDYEDPLDKTEDPSVEAKKDQANNWMKRNFYSYCIEGGVVNGSAGYRSMFSKSAEPRNFKTGLQHVHYQLFMLFMDAYKKVGLDLNDHIPGLGMIAKWIHALEVAKPNLCLRYGSGSKDNVEPQIVTDKRISQVSKQWRDKMIKNLSSEESKLGARIQGCQNCACWKDDGTIPEDDCDMLIDDVTYRDMNDREMIPLLPTDSDRRRNDVAFDWMKRNFIAYCVEGEGTPDPQQYKQMFSPDSQLISRGQMKQIQNQMNNLFIDAYNKVGLELKDYVPSGGKMARWLHVLELQRPNLFLLFGTRPSNLVTDKRLNEIANFWRDKLANIVSAHKRRYQKSGNYSNEKLCSDKIIREDRNLNKEDMSSNHNDRKAKKVKKKRKLISTKNKQSPKSNSKLDDLDKHNKQVLKDPEEIPINQEDVLSNYSCKDMLPVLSSDSVQTRKDKAYDWMKRNFDTYCGANRSLDNKKMFRKKVKCKHLQTQLFKLYVDAYRKFDLNITEHMPSEGKIARWLYALEVRNPNFLPTATRRLKKNKVDGKEEPRLVSEARVKQKAENWRQELQIWLKKGEISLRMNVEAVNVNESACNETESQDRINNKSLEDSVVTIEDMLIPVKPSDSVQVRKDKAFDWMKRNFYAYCVYGMRDGELEIGAERGIERVVEAIQEYRNMFKKDSPLRTKTNGLQLIQQQFNKLYIDAYQKVGLKLFEHRICEGVISRWLHVLELEKPNLFLLYRAKKRKEMMSCPYVTIIDLKVMAKNWRLKLIQDSHKFAFPFQDPSESMKKRIKRSYIRRHSLLEENQITNCYVAIEKCSYTQDQINVALESQFQPKISSSPGYQPSNNQPRSGYPSNKLLSPGGYPSIDEDLTEMLNSEFQVKTEFIQEEQNSHNSSDTIADNEVLLKPLTDSSADQEMLSSDSVQCRKNKAFDWMKRNFISYCIEDHSSENEPKCSEFQHIRSQLFKLYIDGYNMAGLNLLDHIPCEVKLSRWLLAVDIHKPNILLQYGFKQRESRNNNDTEMELEDKITQIARIWRMILIKKLKDER